MRRILTDFLFYLRYRKRWYLLPILLILGALAALIVAGQGSAVAPLIYTLF